MEEDLTLYAFLDGKHWAEEYSFEFGNDSVMAFHMLELLSKERYPSHAYHFMKGVRLCIKPR